MKIAHVIASCASGGAEIFVKSLILSLNKEGNHKIELWVMSRISDIDPSNNQKIDFEKSFIKEIQDNGVFVRFMDKRPGKDFRMTKIRLREAYISFKPDIVHAHLESVTFHVCRALAKFKVPILQTIHSTYIRYPYIQRKYIDKRIKGYIAISDKVRSIIENKVRMNDRKVFLIYNGVNLEKFQTKTRYIGDKVTKIVAIGRLTKAKDHETLLNAINILKAKLNCCDMVMPEVLIVGDGELRENIFSLACSLGIDNYVSFLGIRNDIPEILNNSDIYVMSSEWEGLSISLIEALASSIPIVATEAGSNNEIVINGVNGLLVPIKDPRALADGLYSLISDVDLRRKFSENAEQFINRFDIKTCALKHIQVYKALIQNQNIK